MSALTVGQCQVLDMEKSIVITRVADDQSEGGQGSTSEHWGARGQLMMVGVEENGAARARSQGHRRSC